MTTRVFRCVPWVLLISVFACRSSDVHPTLGSATAARSAPFDVEHYALDVDLDPPAHAFRATCRIRLWPRTEALASVELDFAGADMQVDDVHDERGRALQFTRTGEELEIHLAQVAQRGEPVELAIRYGGKPSKGLWFTHESAGGPTEVFSHGECRDAHWWFPCRDEVTDRATSEIVVHMPETWTSICAGERIERRVEHGRAIERWRTTFPHPTYLETLAAGAFAVKTATWDGIPLVFACDPEFGDQLDTTFKETDKILDFYSRTTGKRYPYPKYAQTCVDDFPFGGMENLSATTLIDTAVSDAEGRADSSPVGLIAHEAAHQWFGDLVTCADWSEAWLNEGFATYFASLYVESARGADEFGLDMQDARDSYVARDAGKNRRPIVFGAARFPIQAFFSGHVYQGGASRLHMLRTLLGDEAFFRGVRLYIGLHQGGSVSTDALREALEEASGKQLKTFFRRWFFDAGHPELEVRTKFDAARSVVVLDVQQTQEGEPFPFPLEVEIADAHGVRRERFDVARLHERFECKAAEDPRWVRVDPRAAVPGRIGEQRTFGAWFALLADAPDAAGRRSAARFLRDALRTKENANDRAEIVAKLVARLDVEPNARVRSALVEALGGRAYADARATLVAHALKDDAPLVRVAALRALENYGIDAENARIAAGALDRKATYAEEAAALGLWARAEPNGGFDRLASALSVPSPHGVRAAHVIDEIARLGDPRSRALLLPLMRDVHAPDDVRAAAARALTSAATGDPDVRKEILALLDSPRFHVRRAGIAALAGVRSPDVIARVARLAESSVYETEISAAQDLVDALQRADGG